MTPHADRLPCDRGETLEYGSDPGACVRRSLHNHPDVYRLPFAPLEIFLMRGLLDEGECAQLISHTDEKRQPSGLLAPAEPDFRTSETCCFSDRVELVSRVEARIDAIMGIDGPYGEKVQGQRYAVGQQFKAHHDFFHTDQPYWPEQQRIAGQRTWTAMAFLNVPEAGGKTFFPAIGLRVTPRRGNLLIWNNLYDDKRPNRASLHQGLLVEAGVKYVLTKWYRERPLPSGAAAIPATARPTPAFAQ
ncbi:MAG: 2OG-Fe(II) oxygenase [Allosphingosinicella sp.]